jgi:hypothetical protein
MAERKGGKAPPPNLQLIEGSLADAKPAPRVSKLKRAMDDIEEPEIPILDPRVPVEPLGKLGLIHYFLDEQKQLIGLDPQKIAKAHIRALFGRKSHLCDEIWPRYSDKTGLDGKPIITGWKPEVAADLLMRACAQRGIFDPQGRVRGTGAHRDDDGELVLHCGDKVFITGRVAGFVDPGLIGRYVYPAGQSRPRPDPLEQDASAGEIVLMKLRAWHWQRPLIDPMLLLGHVGCAMVGGALKWRPHAWITGGTETGKSTLQELLRELQDGALIKTGNATEASLRQLLKQQTLPVFFDELEAAEDNRRGQGVIELARVASSGDQVLRGGQTGEGQEFTVRSCFLFSSILLPPMLTQDRNRLAILELDRIPHGAKPPTIDVHELRELGRKLRRRMVDHWHRLDELVARYKAALGASGHSGRSADQFGTLLAVADLMLYDVADDDNIAEWADRLKAETLAEKATEQPDEEDVVTHLATSFLPVRGGDEPEPIARSIRKALEHDGDKARDRLENFGMRLVQRTVSAKGEIGAKKPDPVTASTDLYLAIANKHVGLARVFAETRWSHGTWTQSLARVLIKVKDGEGKDVERRAERRVKVRFGPGRPDWATLIPLPAILELDPEK